MNKRIFQYILLTTVGIIMIYNFIPIGDYCRGLINVLNLIFYGGLFFIIFIIILSINVYNIFKNKRKFDLTPLIIFISFVLFLYGLFELDYSRFWTTPILKGSISFHDSPDNAFLVLYEDKTFEATYNSADFGCTYVGSYMINNDTLKLERPGLSNETNELFTTEYLIARKDQELKPLTDKYSAIHIIE